jgi:hypothetical protein
MSATAAPPDDLITQLRSNRGATVRQHVLDQLAELELRVSFAIRGGLVREDYRQLEASLLAVRAGRDTLNRLNLQHEPPAKGDALSGFIGQSTSNPPRG